MVISEIHAMALQLLNSDSSDYETGKLIVYCNDGILFVNNQRIQALDPDVITQTTTTYANPISTPTDFFTFIPQKSNYPVILAGGKITPTSSSYPQVTFKYAKKLPRVTTISDTFPMPDEFSGFVAQYISCRLQSDNSMDVTQDLSILSQDIQAFVKAKAGV